MANRFGADPSNGVGMSREADRMGLAIGALLWGLHTVLIAVTFPASELFTQSPLLYIDSPYHMYQMSVARELWEDHLLSGYDPWFAAGYVGGVSYNASAKLPALLAIFLPTMSEIIVYKLFVFSASIAAPGCVLLAMRMLTANSWAIVAGMTLGCLVWWITGMHWYHTAGMVAFVLGSYIALPYIAGVMRVTMNGATLGRLTALSLFGAFGLLLHPLFPIPLIVAVPILALLLRKQMQRESMLAVLLAVPILCLLPNLPWILETIRNPGLADDSVAPFQRVIDIEIAWWEALGEVRGNARGARLNPVLWLFSLLGVLSACSGVLRRWAIGLIASAVVLIIVSAVGALLNPIAVLQPNRLSMTAYLLLVIPAGLGIGRLLGLLQCRIPWTLSLWTGAIALITVVSLLIRELVNEVDINGKPHHGVEPPFVRGEQEYTRWLIAWIQQNTSGNARILFETSLGRVHDGAHIAGYLAMRTQREFIGGPYVFMHHAGFWNGHAFGSPLARFTVDDLTARLNLYNIGWIIAHSVQAKAYFDRHPHVALAAANGTLRIYRSDIPQSYFLQGSGTVTSRRVNRIDLENVSGAEVVLKYHYVAGMVSEPEGIVDAMHVDGDPQPFIRVTRPPKTLSIVVPTKVTN